MIKWFRIKDIDELSCVTIRYLKLGVHCSVQFILMNYQENNFQTLSHYACMLASLQIGTQEFQLLKDVSQGLWYLAKNTADFDIILFPF